MKKIILLSATILLSFFAIGQKENNSTDNGTIFLLFFLAYAALFVAIIFITRAIFNIPTIVKNLKAQTSLLVQIAKKEGVNAEEIKAIEAKLNP